MNPYGQELILDIHHCECKFSRTMLKRFFKQLCELIDMEREDFHFWDYKGDKKGYDVAPAHLKGITAIQFIKTSNITIHSLDELKRIYINIFSCKGFSNTVAMEFCEDYFKGEIISSTGVDRI